MGTLRAGGGRDVYVAFLGEGQSWSSATLAVVRLEGINTPANETSAFLAGEVLYFRSDRVGGEYDLYQNRPGPIPEPTAGLLALLALALTGRRRG